MDEEIKLGISTEISLKSENSKSYSVSETEWFSLNLDENAANPTEACWKLQTQFWPEL